MAARLDLAEEGNCFAFVEPADAEGDESLGEVLRGRRELHGGLPEVGLQAVSLPVRMG